MTFLDTVRKNLSDSRLAAFTVVEDTPPPAGALPVVGGMHQINAPMFGALAPDLVRLGWSVFPQTRDDRRGPGKVHGVAFPWKPLQTRLPTERELWEMSTFCPAHNVAGILGPASGDTFAIDVDVKDPDLSLGIVDLADSILGYTPFRRVGHAPRIVLLYREAGAATAKSDALIRSKKRWFQGSEGHMLEILARGAPVTFFGLHHKTGKYFLWLDRSPHVTPPDAAHEVTRDQLDEFMDALNALRPFKAGTGKLAMAETWSFDAEAGLHVPAELGASDEWNELGGRVVDGREQFLFRLASAAVRANEGAARAGEPGKRNICALVEEQFHARAEVSGKWTSEFLRREIASKVARSISECIEKGAFTRVRPGRAIAVDVEDRVERATVEAEATPTIQPPPLAALAHMKARPYRKGALTGRKPKQEMLARPDAARARERALVMDEEARIAAAQAAVRKVEEFEYRFVVDRLYGRAAERRRLEKAGKKAGAKAELDAGIIQILLGDAGVGKTRSFWKAMARAKAERGPIGYPVGFAAPSHANIEDNLDRAVADKIAWNAQAKARADWDHDVAATKREAERHGLKVVVFKGRARTNCAFKEQMAILDKARIGADRLCKARVQLPLTAPGEKPKYEERKCPFWDQCEYQRTLALVPTVDVILFASAYLSVNAPKALSDALIGLFVDERPYSGLLKDNSREPMPLRLLQLMRATPRLVKAEYEMLRARHNGGAVPREAREDFQNGLTGERKAAVDLVLPHLEKGDVAGALRALHEHRGPVPSDRRGLAYALSAMAVCSRTDDAAKDVQPGMTEAAATALATAPRSEGLWAERRFWKIVVERLEAMALDEDEPLSEPRAAGGKDYRLQILRDEGKEPLVRMSWRGTPSFDGLPILMLDASAEPRIVEKVWAGRVVEVLPVTAPNHSQVVLVTGSTFSDRSLDPGRATRDDDIQDAAAHVQTWRDIITRLAAVHGNGKVLVCSNKNIQPILRHGWWKPLNVDFVWNGAMRGLDFAKDHVAAICIGRMEPPVRAIDAQVAALTYDDACPEEPVDRFGNGMDAEGKELRPLRDKRAIAMRDGSDILIDDTTYAGTWAQIVQRQTRDEEVRQFAARLRTVHRVGDPPVIYVATSAVPEGMIVDEIVHMDDLLSNGPATDSRPWEIARAADGLVDATMGWEHREDLGGRPDGTIPVSVLARLKLDVEGDAESRGTMRIRYRIRGGTWTFASLVMWHDDPFAPLREAIKVAHGIEPHEFADEVEVDVLWRGSERRPSGTKPPDAVDFQLTGLPAGSSAEEIRQAHADMEARDREVMVAWIRHELSGLDLDAAPEAVEAALRSRRIHEIDWLRLASATGGSRKDGTVSLAVRIIAARYGVGAPATLAEDLAEALPGA